MTAVLAGMMVAVLLAGFLMWLSVVGFLFSAIILSDLMRKFLWYSEKSPLNPIEQRSIAPPDR